jgi:hypothetical protein
MELPLPRPQLGRPLWDLNPQPFSATSPVDDVIMTSFGPHILLSISLSIYTLRPSLRKDGLMV